MSNIILKSLNDIFSIEVELNSLFHKEFSQQISVPVLFRGHERQSYELKSTLTRQLTNIDDILIAEKYIKAKVNSFIAHKNKQIEITQPINNFSKEWELLAKMQHVELPTRLLDLTTQILHALYFTVCKKEHDCFNGEIIAFMCSENLYYYDCKTKSTGDKNPYYLNSIDPYNLSEPIICALGYQAEQIGSKILAEQRRYKQQGRFIALPTNDLLNPVNKCFKGNQLLIKRITIPKELKKSIRSELKNKHNTSKRTLLPKSLFNCRFKRMKNDINHFVNQLNKK